MSYSQACKFKLRMTMSDRFYLVFALVLAMSCIIGYLSSEAPLGDSYRTFRYVIFAIIAVAACLTVLAKSRFGYVEISSKEIRTGGFGSSEEMPLDQVVVLRRSEDALLSRDRPLEVSSEFRQISFTIEQENECAAELLRRCPDMGIELGAEYPRDRKNAKGLIAPASPINKSDKALRATYLISFGILTVLLLALSFFG